MNAQQIDSFRNEIEDSLNIKKLLKEDLKIITQFFRLSKLCVQAIKDGNKIIFAGNGGSFADAQHLSAEFTSRFRLERNAMASIALGTNSSAMSAIGNDYGFEKIFSRELESIGGEGDIFIPITTSGNSKNIVEAIKKALELNIQTYCLTGLSGGMAIDLCNCICVPSTKTERIQECHILLGHMLCGHIEKTIFPDPSTTEVI